MSNINNQTTQNSVQGNSGWRAGPSGRINTRWRLGLGSDPESLHRKREQRLGFNFWDKRVDPSSLPSINLTAAVWSTFSCTLICSLINQFITLCLLLLWFTVYYSRLPYHQQFQDNTRFSRAFCFLLISPRVFRDTWINTNIQNPLHNISNYSWSFHDLSNS